MPIVRWPEAESQIADALRRLISEGGDGNFVIISCGDAYVQFAASHGKPELYCEAVSNQYLPKDQRLAPEKIDRLEQLGFDLDDSTGQYAREFRIGKDQDALEIARQTTVILAELYGCRSAGDIKLELTLE